jgi:NitT/TauT family transport system ATP-binding protein
MSETAASSPAAAESEAGDGERAITAVGVTRRYLRGKFTAVDDISIDVPEGQVVAFVGPSGCGKTTMLRMIAGLEEPTEGDISVYGNPVLGPGPDRGMIFQAYTSFPWLSARGNVEYGMKILGVPKEERRRKATKLLEEVHLAKFADAYPSELSGGMKQRVAIARTLAQNPNVLLMDEPFGALDAQVRWEMQEMMIELIEVEKKTVIAVTHDIQEAIYLADRIVFYTRSPGRIKEDIMLDFKQGKRFPQKEALLAQPGYIDLERQMFAWMREEIKAD